MESKGDILCLHYYFPPLRSTAVIRNYHFSQAFSNIFSKVHVITSDNFKNAPIEERSLSHNTEVYDVYTLDYRSIIGRKKKDDVHISMKKKSSRSFQYLLKIQKSYPFNLILGEGNMIYIQNAYKKAKQLIETNNINTIYSSFAPYADHYIAYKLKKKYPNIRWIADFRDLQIEPIYKNVIWKSLQQKKESQVLGKADKVISISESYADQLRVYNKNVSSVLRGVELRPEMEQYEKFTIAYTGSLYFNYRDPRRLLEEISKMIKEGNIDLENIQLIYAGRDGAQFGEWVVEAGLSAIYEDKGMVTIEKVKEIQSKSHINLLLTSSSKDLQGVLTGKLFEYFEAGNPILCLINGVKDIEFESLVENLNAGCVVYSPKQVEGKLSNYILEKYNEKQRNGSVQHIIDKSVLIKEYSWQRQAERLLS